MDFSLSGNIPIIAQPDDMSCWAATATMMVSWKEKKELSINNVVKKTGPVYEDRLNRETGITGKEKTGFLSSLKLRSKTPQMPTVSGWLSLLKTNGPLWVTTNENADQLYSAHARIIKGIFGDGTPEGTFLRIIDPDGGKESVETVEDFAAKFELLARQDLGETGDFRPQIVHF